MQERPIISIIMSTWNRAHLIGETLKSISRQSFTDWECLIIDDGSTDETEEKVTQFINLDKRYKYFKRSGEYKKGISGSRNCGLDKAKGDFIVFFDDDDIVHPDNLLCSYKILNKENADFCRYEKLPFQETGDLKNIKTVSELKQREWDLNQLSQMVTGEMPFASCTVMWTKECFKKERFNENLQYAEEWECYSRILSRGVSGISINQVLYFNRKHAHSNTGEFHNDNRIRKDSKVLAAELIIKNLASKELLTRDLKKFFLRLGFSLGSYRIIDHTLQNTENSEAEKLKYKIGFLFYPFLRPIFLLKARL